MAYHIIGPDGSRMALDGKTRFSRHREAQAALKRHLDCAFKKIVNQYKIQLANGRKSL